ncbi:MAG: DUF3108 domain-containing protein [Bdellovibrionales bacterium]|nr:DUF3108 domain-containing protein [Bdellovibrionales bacterium]
MNLTKIFTLLFTLSLVSCATNYEEEKAVLMSKPENTDLVNSFDAKKAESEIFTENPKVEEKSPVKPEEKVELNSKKKVSAKKETSLKKVTPGALAITAPATTAIPADYPEEFKAYDDKAKGVWSKFSPVFYQGEQSIMAVTYLGVTAGHITIHSKEITTLNSKPAYHFYARFKSSDSYRYFYWLDDKLDSYVEKETFLPMKYSLVQREKKQNVDDLQLFDFKKMMTYNWYKRVKEGSNKDEKGEAKIPRYAQDSFSALQFVRGMPLNKGETYEFPVITRGKFWILKVEVVGEETIEIMDQDVKAIKIKAETNFPGVLKKSGDILFWYSADQERKFLKFQAKIKLGSLYGELVEYKPGVKAQ